MQAKIDSLFEEAMRLTESDRAVLTERLMASLSESEIMRDWIQEAECRLDEIENGEVEEIPYDEAMKQIRENRGRGNKISS